MAQMEMTATLGLGLASRMVIPVGHAASDPASAHFEGLLPWQARRVRAYIDGDLGGRPTLRIAAEHAKLSPSYFGRRFRQSFGQTFSRFVAHRRIERAQAMMVRSTLSLSQIALDCGFNDQSHFTRTFGGVTGATPSRWRRWAASAALKAGAMGAS